MISTFWSNTIWYVLLGAVNIVQLIFVISKAERPKQTFAFFLTVFGITLFVETALLIYFKAYVYYPFVLKYARNPFDDVLAGNLFSQFSIATTLLFVVVLKLKPYWYFIFAILYGFIEELFLALGIYTHNWYQTWITVIMLPVAFLLIKIMYIKIIQSIKPVFYYGCIILALFPLNIITLTWALMLTGIQDMSLKVLPDPIMSRHSIVLVLFFILAIPIIYMHFAKLKLYSKALVIIMLYILYYIGYKLNLILIKEGWFLLVSTAIIFWMYLSIFLLDKLYGEPLKKH